MPLLLYVTDGTLEDRGRSVALTPRESELLSYLGIERRVIDRDVLLEELFGRHDKGGRNQLKVYVSRVRRTLGYAAIQTRGSGYGLGSGIRVELHEIESLLKGPLDESGIALLRDYSARLSDGARPPWPWLVRHESRMASVELALHRFLAARDLEAGRFVSAVVFAHRAIARDPFDEASRRLAVDICLAAGDPISAKKEIENYRRFLHEEMGGDASRDFLATYR